MHLGAHEPTPPAPQPTAVAEKTTKRRARGGRPGRAESPRNDGGGASSSAAAAQTRAARAARPGAPQGRTGSEAKPVTAAGSADVSAAVAAAPGGTAASGDQPPKKKHRTANDQDHVARIEALGHMVLEGVSVSLETKIDFRLGVTCPCKGHHNHRATRRFDMGSEASSELGDAEAYAFFGNMVEYGAFHVQKGSWGVQANTDGCPAIRQGS